MKGIDSKSSRKDGGLIWPPRITVGLAVLMLARLHPPVARGGKIGGAYLPRLLQAALARRTEMRGRRVRCIWQPRAWIG